MVRFLSRVVLEALAAPRLRPAPPAQAALAAPVARSPLVNLVIRPLGQEVPAVPVVRLPGRAARPSPVNRAVRPAPPVRWLPAVRPVPGRLWSLAFPLALAARSAPPARWFPLLPAVRLVPLAPVVRPVPGRLWSLAFPLARLLPAFPPAPAVRLPVRAVLPAPLALVARLLPAFPFPAFRPALSRLGVLVVRRSPACRPGLSVPGLPFRPWCPVFRPFRLRLGVLPAPSALVVRRSPARHPDLLAPLAPVVPLAPVALSVPVRPCRPWCLGFRPLRPLRVRPWVLPVRPFHPLPVRPWVLAVRLPLLVRLLPLRPCGRAGLLALPVPVVRPPVRAVLPAPLALVARLLPAFPFPAFRPALSRLGVLVVRRSPACRPGLSVPGLPFRPWCPVFRPFRLLRPVPVRL